MRSPAVNVSVNLAAIRAAAERIRRRTGVALIAVVKADAYGLGAPEVAVALSGVADEFAYFRIEEAREVLRPGLVLGPPHGDPGEYSRLNLRPAIATPEDAARFSGLPVAIKVDAGMQRFGCPPQELDDLIARCQVVDFFAHAVTLDSAERLRAACAGRGRPMHAAATSLLDEPRAWMDAVRPGLALYRGALRVTARLSAVKDTTGPIGYTGVHCPRIGIILAGYSNLVQPGPVLVNGRLQRVLEAGMNTSYLSVDPQDRVGDEVVLLGEGPSGTGTRLDEPSLAAHFHVREHEILCRYAAMGPRTYLPVT